MPSSELQHKTIKAAATATDKGEFSAIAAAYSVDRVKDKIIPGAFEQTIKAWQASGKMLPLHWDHGGNAEDIIGFVNPASMQEREEGLYVEGQLDLKSSAIARDAWRSMKNNAVALSFGYLTQKSRKSGDVNELLQLDLFEITVTPAPVQPDARFLSLKAMKEELKAQWSTAYLADLPDSAFLHVESGAEKDPDGKSARHFPYKDSSGTIDLPHLRNALARIPQSNLPQETKDTLTAKAQRILDNATKALHQVSAVEDGGDEEPTEAKSAPQDPLVQEAWNLILPKGQRRRPEPEPEPDESLDKAEVEREAWALALKSSGT